MHVLRTQLLFHVIFTSIDSARWTVFAVPFAGLALWPPRFCRKRAAWPLFCILMFPSAPSSQELTRSHVIDNLTHQHPPHKPRALLPSDFLPRHFRAAPACPLRGDGAPKLLALGPVVDTRIVLLGIS